MGGDGGSIPKRGDVVKTKGYEFKRDLGGMGYMPNTQIKQTIQDIPKIVKMHEKWTRCSLSNEILNPPIVICRKGFLYNKESILNELLNRKKSKHLSHIKKLSDTFNVKNQFNKSSNCLICPINNKDLDNFTRAVYHKCCGFIISLSGLKSIDNYGNNNSFFINENFKCINCDSNYNPDKDEIKLFTHLNL